MLLPFLDAPTFPDTPESSSNFMTDALTEVASTCLLMAAYKGNAREVYLKVLAALSSLSFTSATHSPPTGGADEPPLTPSSPYLSPLQARENGHRKFRILILLLTIIHSRITTAYPSRFLSQSLTTLLSTFTRSVEELQREDVEDIMTRLLSFIDSVQPHSTKKKRRSTEQRLGPDGRPALPPRVNTSGSEVQTPDISKLTIQGETEEERKERIEKEEKAQVEEDMQIRLLQSFLSHVVEAYILRCPSEYSNKIAPSQAARTPEVKHDEQNSLMQFPSARGINLHLASRCLKSHKFLTGGVIESEILPSPPTLWKEVLNTAYQLSLMTKELQELCYAHTPDTEAEEPVEPTSPPPGVLSFVPKFVEDIPLSKIGSLILLASRIYERESILDWKIRLFPEHKTIVHTYLTKGNGISEVGVLDAVLFLGAWALSPEGGGFGEVVDDRKGGDEEGWLMYLQVCHITRRRSFLI